MHDSGCGQVLIIKHVLCVTPRNEHNIILLTYISKSCALTPRVSPINTWLSFPLKHLYHTYIPFQYTILIVCDTGIYAIIPFSSFYCEGPETFL